jgi:hypothetical protein
MSTNYKFNQAQDKLITEAQRVAGAYLLTKYGSAHLVGEPKVELTYQTNPISNAVEFTGKILVKADVVHGKGFSTLDVNMSINENNIEVESDNIQANIVEALNAATEHNDVVTASLDAFSLTDDGTPYLKVSHIALNDASLGQVGKNEYKNSPDRSELLQTIVKDAMARVANETTISFTGEFKEPVIEIEAKGHTRMCGEPESTEDSENCPNLKWHDLFEKSEKKVAEKTKTYPCPKCGDELDAEGVDCRCSQPSAKKSWLTADLMSEDPEPYADSEQLEETDKYVLWSTPYADHTTYWVSDKEGAELAAFNTIEEARAAMATGQGLEMLDEASVAINNNMPKASMSDTLAQSMQAEQQMHIAAQEKIKNEAVNSLVAMLQGMGYGSSKIAEVSMTDSKIDAMVTLDHAGTTKAVNIPVTIVDAKVVLPKKSLVSELINKGLDIRAKMAESFSQEVLEKIAAIEELENYKEAEANAILAERPTVKKEASGSDNMQTLGDTDTLELQKHLIPGHEDLKKGDKISDGSSQWEIVDTEWQQNDKNENSSSIWKLRKCAPPKSDEKEPETKVKI